MSLKQMESKADDDYRYLMIVRSDDPPKNLPVSVPPDTNYATRIQIARYEGGLGTIELDNKGPDQWLIDIGVCTHDEIVKLVSHLTDMGSEYRIDREGVFDFLDRDDIYTAEFEQSSRKLTSTQKLRRWIRIQIRKLQKG